MEFSARAVLDEDAHALREVTVEDAAGSAAGAANAGDPDRPAVEANPPAYRPLTLAPGQSGRINVTFHANGRRGDTVRGTLYIDTFGVETLTDGS